MVYVTHESHCTVMFTYLLGFYKDYNKVWTQGSVYTNERLSIHKSQSGRVRTCHWLTVTAIARDWMTRVLSVFLFHWIVITRSTIF
uniref:Putative ovule protein n=1 Tax=Solanum chacoense TaxID=4108 RepID=A0A0V0GPC3_SOLCH